MTLDPSRFDLLTDRKCRENLQQTNAKFSLSKKINKNNDLGFSSRLAQFLLLSIRAWWLSRLNWFNFKFERVIMKKTAIGMAIAALLASPAFAASFVNGNFEAGTTGATGNQPAGWTLADSYFRGGVNNAGLTPALVLASGDTGSHSAIIDTSYVDPNLGAVLGSTVFSGNYSFRVEDTTTGGYASAISQTVANYTDPQIFFAWKAVLLGAHGASDAATMRITLTDNGTAGAPLSNLLIDRTYNAASGGGGVDPRFSLSGGNYYTPLWQTEQLTIGAALSGHDFTLSVLAADCQPTGHWGYVYLDGFGAVNPPPGDGGTVPEPASLALVGLGLAGLAAARRRKNV